MLLTPYRSPCKSANAQIAFGGGKEETGDMRDRFMGRRHGTKMQEEKLLITRGHCGRGAGRGSR